MSIVYEQTVEFTFHNVEYILHAFVDGKDQLVVEAEQKSNGQRWNGQFSDSYIEQMTRKTGNFKKFPVFLRMLSTALSASSESVFIDLLTSADLEMLKARKTGRAPVSNPLALNNEKRYLILTYVVEFDRVHYPLPLKFERFPDPAALQSTILRLRSEIEELRVVASQSAADNPSLAKLKAEHYRLTQDNRRLTKLLTEHKANSSSSGPNSDDTKSSNHELEAQQYRAHALADALEKKEEELEKLRIENQQLSVTESARVRALEQRVAELETALHNEKEVSKRLVLKGKRELRALAAELENSREEERATRARLRELKSSADRVGRGTRRTAGRRVSTPSRPRSRVGSRSSSRPGSAKKSRRPRSPYVGRRRGRGSKAGSRASSRAGSPSPSLSRGTSPARRGSKSGKRFDPSAWVKAKQKQRRDSKLRASRSRSRSNSRTRSTRRPRTSSRSRRSSRDFSSAASSPARSRGRVRRNRSSSKAKPNRGTAPPTPSNGSPVVIPTASSQFQDPADDPLMVAPDDPSAVASRDISHIHDRLSSLQDFLHASKSRTNTRQ